MNSFSKTLLVRGRTFGSSRRFLTAHSRFANFYGQNGARLTNDQTIYGFQPKRTYLIKLLSIFLFYAPELHLRGTRGRRVLCPYILRPRPIGLESVYTDFVVSQHRWVEFITKLQSEWAEFILYVSIPQSLRCGDSYVSGLTGDCAAECQHGILVYIKC